MTNWRTHTKRIFKWPAVVPLAVALLLAAVLLSPLTLDLFYPDDLRWEQRSLVGQTYGAVSAIIAALALGGVAISVVMQARDSRSSRIFAVREAHREILSQALANPDLLECVGTPGAEDLDAKGRRQYLYCHVTYSWWTHLYELGEISSSEALANADAFFLTAPARDFWRRNRSIRIDRSLPTKSRLRRHWELFDERYRALVTAEVDAPDPPPQHSDIRQPATPTQ